MTHQRNQMINQTKEHQHAFLTWDNIQFSLSLSGSICAFLCLLHMFASWGKWLEETRETMSKPRCSTQPPLLLSFPPCCPRPPPRTVGLEDAPPWINKTESHYVDDFWGNVQVWLMWKPICMLHPKATQWIWMTTLIYGNCNCFISLCKSTGSGIRVVIDN